MTPLQSRFSGLLAITTTALLLFGSAFKAEASEYIVNGGFEDGNFNGWSTSQVACCSGVSNLAIYGGYLPNSGSYYAYLSGDPTSTLSQTFTDTLGQTLQISFFLASNGVFSSTQQPGSFFEALFNTSVLQSVSNVPSTGSPADSTVPYYVEYTYDVTATGSDTLEFEYYDYPSYLALDDVSVTNLSSATPIPGALPLFAGGLGMVGLLTRRKRRNA